METVNEHWMSGVIAADIAMASHASARSLDARRQRRLNQLVTATIAGSGFYRDQYDRHHFRGIDASLTVEQQLQRLPIVRKADLMRSFGSWVTDPQIKLEDLHAFLGDCAQIAEPFLGRYMVWESSGSSGEPGIFVQDAAAMAVQDGLEALRRPALRPLQRLLDPWHLTERIAFVGATTGHFAGMVSVARLKRLLPAIADRVFEISFLQPTPMLLAELEAAAPTIITTYPSAAVLLAEEKLAGRLKLDPQEIQTGGEALTPAMRRFVSEAFGCPVSSSYGASEFLSMAYECRFGQLHLNSDWAILESVDASGNVLPVGERGSNSLLTNLANFRQPLIRYELGDRILQRAKACGCGSGLPVIEVDGRSDDTLYLGSRAATAVLPLALSTVIEEAAGLFDFQLQQKGPCELLLLSRLSAQQEGGALGRASSALTAFLLAQGVDELRIECRCGIPFQLGRSGKIKRVIKQEPQPA